MRTKNKHSLFIKKKKIAQIETYILAFINLTLFFKGLKHAFGIKTNKSAQVLRNHMLTKDVTYILLDQYFLRGRLLFALNVYTFH